MRQQADIIDDAAPPTYQDSCFLVAVGCCEWCPGLHAHRTLTAVDMANGSEHHAVPAAGGAQEAACVLARTGGADTGRRCVYTTSGSTLNCLQMVQHRHCTHSRHLRCSWRCDLKSLIRVVCAAETNLVTPEFKTKNTSSTEMAVLDLRLWPLHCSAGCYISGRVSMMLISSAVPCLS